MSSGAGRGGGVAYTYLFNEDSRREALVKNTTEPLGQDIEVTGEITVSLWASSSAVDTDFTAKLIDVYPTCPGYPGGFDLNVGDGII